MVMFVNRIKEMVSFELRREKEKDDQKRLY